MTDPRTIATRYIELWNERNPQRRRDILAANWASDAKYVDPLMSGDGHDAIRQFHSAGVKAGGRDNGGAGPRADYSPTYFAAFLIDPDGNNVEAVKA